MQGDEGGKLFFCLFWALIQLISMSFSFQEGDGDGDVELVKTLGHSLPAFDP